MPESIKVRKADKLPSLDSARFIAAFMVVLFHSTFTIEKFYNVIPVYGIFRGGHSGVEYFFVLSGFIIYYSHSRDFSNHKSIPVYFRKRANRIIPMLWMTLLLWYFVRSFLARYTTNDPTPLSTLALDMLLLPHSGPLILGVTWTLQRELVFYALFAIALWSKRTGLVVLAAWQIATVIVSFSCSNMGPWLTAIFDIQNVGFGVGLLIAFGFERVERPAPASLLTVGAVMFVTLSFIEWRIGGPFYSEFRPLGSIVGPLLYTLTAGVLLVGLIAKDSRKDNSQNAIFALLGGASYVLYLTHGPVGSIIVRLAVHFRAPAHVTFIFVSVVPVLVAVALHVWVERPVLQRLKQPAVVNTYTK